MSQINLMALRHSAFYSPFLMTLAGGYLHDEGLEPAYVLETPERTVADSLRDGSCHVAQSAVATSFAALEQGAAVDIVHFAQINERDGFFIAGREPQPDFEWSNLKGRKVLVDHFFQPMAMLKYGLHREGMSLTDLEVMDAGDVTAIEQAFRNGEADYVHMQGPAPQQLEHEGLGHIVAAVGDAVGPVAFSSLCAKREWLDTDMALAFTRAYRKARAHVISAPAVEIAALEQEYGFFSEIEPAVLAQTIQAYKKLGCWTPSIEISAVAYENLLDVFAFSGAITKRHPYESCVVPPPL
jgi:NitT/TauT family transport system substrate-binding protein